MWTLKTLFAPTGATRSITAIKTWRVDWYSRTGTYASDYKIECEFFTLKDDAEYFANQLKAAIKLLRYKGSDYDRLDYLKVTVKENE